MDTRDTAPRRATRPGVRLANEAWESLLRAQVALTREFWDSDAREELSEREYDVLYQMSKAPGGLRMSEVTQRVLISQSGISRLVERLESRGLVQRGPDPDDTRARRLALTEHGRELQRATGRRHARQVARAMNRALTPEQISRLYELCSQLTAAAEAHQARKGNPAT